VSDEDGRRYCNCPSAAQFQTAQLLGPINGDGITVIHPKRPEFFLANELIDQIDLGLFDLAYIDAAQQAEKGIGMEKALQFGKEQA
jgi:hypothetical protein